MNLKFISKMKRRIPNKFIIFFLLFFTLITFPQPSFAISRVGIHDLQETLGNTIFKAIEHSFMSFESGISSSLGNMFTFFSPASKKNTANSLITTECDWRN